MPVAFYRPKAKFVPEAVAKLEDTKLQKTPNIDSVNQVPTQEADEGNA
jgi:hypothetical protein